ncbi:MAG: hypothetical protein DCC55_21210 [Chloroflexi bacterium]|nr:MAG: hypothetical protein DCC55_21210 [Chloroflexota bacterium]
MRRWQSCGKVALTVALAPTPVLVLLPFLRPMNTFPQRCYMVVLFVLLVSGVGACAWPFDPGAQVQTGSCTLSLPPDAGDEAAIRALLAAEGELVVKQEIDPLMDLWADGGFVSDAKNTPTNPDDDQFWLDKDAIRHRYVRTVFPGAPQQATPADLVIEIDAGRAVVTATTRIGDEISPAGDRWVLVQRGRCWLIESLTYNLEPASLDASP